MTIQTLNNNVTLGEQRAKINANFAELDQRVADAASDAADASDALAAHAVAADPHPKYLTRTEGDQRYAAAGITGATNLGATASPTGVTVTSDTGADAVLPLADGTNAGLMAPAQVTKLAGLPASAVQPTDIPPDGLLRSYVGPVSPLVPVLSWGTAEPSGMRRYGPVDPCVWVSGIAPTWDNATARWVLSGTSPRLIRVITSGLRVALGWVCLAADAERFRVYINGRPTSTAAAVQSGVATVAGTTYWLTITLPENLQGEDRTVEILMTGAQGLIAVDLEPGTEKAVIRPTRKLGLVTDSFGGGGGTNAVDSMATLAALQLGCDFHAEVEGGAGFAQVGANGLTFSAASKVSRMGAFGPQTLIYLSGVNDDPTAAGYAAAISTTLTAYAAACPGVRQVAIGPMPTAAVSTIGGTWRPLQTAAIKSAISAAGGYYIDTTGLDEAGGVPAAYAAGTTYTAGQYVTHVGAIWRATGSGIVGRAPGVVGGTGSTWSQVGVIKLNGTGKAGATTGDGNRDTLLSNDGTHYTYPAGHVYSAVELAAALRAGRHVLSSAGAVTPRAGEVGSADVLRALSGDTSNAPAVRTALGLGPIATMTLTEAQSSVSGDRAKLNTTQQGQQTAGATTALLSADKSALLDPVGGPAINIRRYKIAGTLAQVLAVTGAAGDEALATDIGSAGVVLRWSASGAWRLGATCNLRTQMTQVVGVADATEQVLGQFDVPAGMLQLCDYWSIHALWVRSSVAANATCRVRLGVGSPVSSDTIILSYTQLGASGLTFPAASCMQVTPGNTSQVRPIGAQNGLEEWAGIVSGSGFPNPVNLGVSTATTDLKLTATMQLASSGPVPSICAFILKGHA